jgi:hypothetical protein
MIVQAATNPLHISTLTVKNMDGQDPEEVWACISGVNAATAPGCERPVQQSGGQYTVNFDYNEIVKDM